jgi:protein phosphatase PTC7
MSHNLYSGVFNIPHTEKEHRGGEDSFVVSTPTNSTIAVADGVGGWSSKGVNPRAFADEILTKTYKIIKSGEIDPKTAIKSAYPVLRCVGSATLCFGKMTEDGIFRVANIGDSGFMVIRRGEILIESAEQQHGFNYPYQLGIGVNGEPHGADRPEDAEVYRMQLEKKDIIIMGTDGLFDNIWPQKILDYINSNALNPIDLSKGLATKAFEESKKDDNNIPFFHRAKEANKQFSSFKGGKEDDITVIVSIVGGPQFF